MKSKSKRGRQTLCTVSRQRRICALLGEGVTIQTAANLCGIAERTYHDWVSRAHAGQQPFASFLDAASRARDSWKARLVLRVEQASRHDWKAAAFLLERQFANEFAPRHADGEEPEPRIVYLSPPTTQTTVAWNTPPLEALTEIQREYLQTLKQ